MANKIDTNNTGWVFYNSGAIKRPYAYLVAGDHRITVEQNDDGEWVWLLFVAGDDMHFAAGRETKMKMAMEEGILALRDRLGLAYSHLVRALGAISEFPNKALEEALFTRYEQPPQICPWCEK